MGSQSNTMFFSDKPADLQSLMVQTMAAIKSLDSKPAKNSSQ
jgi:hypothetical protein